MVSGHVGEGCPFWPYPRTNFPVPLLFPPSCFGGPEACLSSDLDVSGSGLRRFAPAKPSQLPTASSLKDRIQVQALTSLHSALYQVGQTRSLARSIRSLAARSFPVFWRKGKCPTRRAFWHRTGL